MNDPVKTDTSLKYSKGRGALSNPANRYESLSVKTDARYIHDDERPGPVTELIEDHSRSIISFNESPDIPFEQSINPYRGCEHGCVYCYARPTHAYLGFSPGLDFETKILIKPNAPELLKRYLSRNNYSCRPIAFGTNTDAYQPVEKRLRIMRQLLEMLCQYRHPLTIVTKSALICRDLDLLSDMARDNLCRVAVSVTSLDARLSHKLEPRAAAPHSRIRTIESLSSAKVPVTVMIAPVIPFLNDSEIESILKRVADAGAAGAGYILLRLPHEVKTLFRQWLDVHEPLKANHIMSLVKQTRGGREYDNRYGYRMRGTGEYARLISRRFAAAKKKHGLYAEMAPMNTKLFVKPGSVHPAQLNLWNETPD